MQREVDSPGAHHPLPPPSLANPSSDAWSVVRENFPHPRSDANTTSMRMHTVKPAATFGRSMKLTSKSLSTRVAFFRAFGFGFVSGSASSSEVGTTDLRHAGTYERGVQMARERTYRRSRRLLAIGRALALRSLASSSRCTRFAGLRRLLSRLLRLTRRWFRLRLGPHFVLRTLIPISRGMLLLQKRVQHWGGWV